MSQWIAIAVSPMRSGIRVTSALYVVLTGCSPTPHTPSTPPEAPAPAGGDRSSLTAPSSRFSLVYNNHVVLADQAKLEWGHGDPALRQGSFPKLDPACERNPPEYDQDGYWECHNNHPDNFFQHYIASRALADDPTARFAQWTRRKWKLYGAGGAVCTTELGRLILYAELKAKASSVGTAADSPQDLAHAVLRDGDKLVAADTAPDCAKAAFARDARLPPPQMWRIRGAATELERAMRRAAESHRDYAEIAQGLGPPSVAFNTLTAPAPAPQYAFAHVVGPSRCEASSELFILWKVVGPRSQPTLTSMFEHVHTLKDNEGPAGHSARTEPISVTAAADLNADGVPELILQDGVVQREGGSFDRLVLVEFEGEARVCDD